MEFFDIVGIKEVDFDKVLEYEDILNYVLTSDKFNTENIMIIPTKNGLEFGLKVRFINRQGKICYDVRKITSAANIPSILIGADHTYIVNFPQEECLVDVTHLQSDSVQTNWFRHSVAGFPIFTRDVDSFSAPEAQKSVFQFPSQLEGTKYAVPGYTLSYLSKKGLCTLMNGVRDNPELQNKIIERIASSKEKKMSKNGIIMLDLQELDTGIPCHTPSIPSEKS